MTIHPFNCDGQTDIQTHSSFRYKISSLTLRRSAIIITLFIAKHVVNLLVMAEVVNTSADSNRSGSIVHDSESQSHLSLILLLVLTEVGSYLNNI